GFNSIRTLAARLQYLQAISGDRLACLPLELRLRGKSTRQSHGSPIFYVDITVRSGLSIEAALQHARETDEVRQASGFDQQALDAAARQGFANGAFEESEEEGGAIVDEFFPEPAATTATSPALANEQITASTRPTLSTLLRERAEARNQQPIN
ncbi:hydrolase or metal-binding protein, partial [Pseudomonas aeruginosa]|nr:hydrolase or metal-binding protein [Pseudomonas aeruginosa]